MASLTVLITNKIILTGCWLVGKDLEMEKESGKSCTIIKSVAKQGQLLTQLS